MLFGIVVVIIIMMKTNINNQTGPVPEGGKITASAGNSKIAVAQLFSALLSRCLLCLWKSPGKPVLLWLLLQKEKRLRGTSGGQKCDPSQPPRLREVRNCFGYLAMKP